MEHIDGDQLQVYMSFARLLWKSECISEAVELFERTVPINSSDDFRRHLYLGYGYKALANYERMVSHWLKIDAFRLLVEVADSLYDGRQLASALKVYKAIPPSRLRDFRLSYAIGAKLISYDELMALEFLKRSVELNPTEWWAQIMIGDVYLAHEDWDVAGFWYDQARRIARKDPRPLLRLANLEYGRARYRAMLPYLEQALDLDRAYSTTYFSYAKYYAAIGEHRLAVASTCRAISLEEDEAGISFYYRWLHNIGGDCN